MIRVTQQDAWAAAACAWRLNGERYLTAADAWRHDANQFLSAEDAWDHELTGPVKQANKDIVVEQLLTGMPLVTDADRELGALAFKAVTRNITYSLLAGHTVTEYERRVGDISQKAEWVLEVTTKGKNPALWTAKYEWATLSSQIRRYFQIQEKTVTAQKIEPGFAGEVGARVDTPVTVVSSNFSSKFLCHFVTALTAENQLVFFAYKDGLKDKTQYRIRGSVKSHSQSREYGTDLTQLNRVRIVKPKGE